MKNFLLAMALSVLFCLLRAFGDEPKTKYVPSEEIPQMETAAMGKRFPHITIDGQRLDYKEGSYVYAEVPTTGRWKGQEQKALWLEIPSFDPGGKMTRMLSDQPDRKDDNGFDYRRQSDGNWLSTGQRFHKDEDGVNWEQDILVIDQIAMHWDKSRQCFIEYETNEIVKLIWKDVKGCGKTRAMLRTQRAHKLNPRSDDQFQPEAMKKQQAADEINRAIN